MMVQQTELLARYKHLCRVGLEQNTRLVKSLDRSVIDEGGKKLGILKRNVLTLDTEDEIAVLMDYCLHDVRRHGVTAIERYLSKSPAAPDSDEWILLQAKQRAYYALLAVESTDPGVGVHVLDLLRVEPLFLVDVGFSLTATVGMVLAARVMVLEGFTLTTGAALPVGVLSAAEQSQFLGRLRASFPGMDFRNLAPEEASELTANIIRSCLRKGAAERIKYIEPGRVSELSPPGKRTKQNDPCPCASGKKFKQCCGARS